MPNAMPVTVPLSMEIHVIRCEASQSMTRRFEPVFIDILLFLATVAASVVWTLVTLYQVAHSRQLTAWKAVMLGFALLLLLVTLWIELQTGASS